MVPRWNATSPEMTFESFYPLILTFLSFMLLGTSVYWAVGIGSILSYFLVILSITVTIYFVGRIYGELNRGRDYIEISSEGLKYRSTPPFGMGWLPKVEQLKFSEIHRADIVSVTNFYNPKEEMMAILLELQPGGRRIIGNNLTKDQILKIGMALKGNVTLSRMLSKLLGEGNIDDPLKELVGTAKNIWSSFKNRRK